MDYDNEKEENTKALKKELKQVDYLKEFTALGVDIHITNGRQFSLVCNLVRNDRLITAIDLGKLSYPVKQNNGNTINIDYKKENLEEQLKSNSPFIPHEVRRELDVFLYRCKHEQKESTNPLYSPQEKLMMRMNNLNDTNNELTNELKGMENDRLLSYLGDMSFIRETISGSDLNKDFQCEKFKADQEYHKFIVGVKVGGDNPMIESTLLIREHEHKGVKGFVGGVISYQDGLHSLQTFKPIQSLDRELLREVLSRPNPLLEADKQVEPEPVKSNVVPFEKPQEETVDHDEADLEDDEPDEPEVTQKKRHKLKI
ncbi:hypothetical protein [Pseudomonas sp. HY7a-MNA-CIBAN-0227]|uniref:hypothetical protein n=1 Tax=Pseudomonas sp. HY7a-MNA-CIBAN-0227 TaxID=3140474 RepID=UPI0033192841